MSVSKVCVGAPLCGTPPSSAEYLPAVMPVIEAARSPSAASPKARKTGKPRLPGRSALAPKGLPAGMSGPMPAGARSAVPSSKLVGTSVGIRPHPTMIAARSEISGSTMPVSAPPPTYPMARPARPAARSASRRWPEAGQA